MKRGRGGARDRYLVILFLSIKLFYLGAEGGEEGRGEGDHGG